MYRAVHDQLEGTVLTRALRLFEERYADPYLSYFIVSNSKVKQRWPDLWQFVDAANNAPPASTSPLSATIPIAGLQPSCVSL